MCPQPDQITREVHMLTPATRTEVRSVECPYCMAAPLQKCEGKRGTREANHMERVRAYAVLEAAEANESAASFSG